MFSELFPAKFSERERFARSAKFECNENLRNEVEYGLNASENLGDEVEYGLNASENLGDEVNYAYETSKAKSNTHHYSGT